ncbi:MAG: hypothetical protein ACLQE9_05800 [Roseiarcus sp.]
MTSDDDPFGRRDRTIIHPNRGGRRPEPPPAAPASLPRRDIGAEASPALRVARRFDPRPAFAAQTFWWTIGGQDFAPMALALRGLPRPHRFADFLTGAFRVAAVEGA